MDNSEDVKVDILECNNLTDESQEGEEALCESSSSSFGDSMCARDDEDGDNDNDLEAESMLNKDYPLPEASFGDGAELLGLRKKKVTDEWRKFCQPLMWRCKWLELKAKEIESQARWYDKEVRSYYQSKESNLEGFDGKLKPFGDQTQRMSVFKRGRRRRVEETTDVAAYISNHNVFSYAEKRKPTTLKAQCPVPGTSRKATVKEEEVEDEVEDDCFVSESDRSDDILGLILCKIDEAQDKARRLKKRVDQLLCESQAGHTSLMPATVTRSRRDFSVQNVKQLAMVEEEPLMNQREGTVQIGRQRISADHTEDLLMIPPQAAPPPESDGQFLYNVSPLPYGRLGFPTVEDLLIDGSEMNDYEAEPELDHCFMKLMNEFGRETMSEEADDDEEEEEDPTPAAKRHKTSH
ncbi:unnamed protein product [Eruca vesicaria subsp. sativa]|uniref:Uncharacterized protein n=1 Tax=Eruca vesicaria subsp. sativa TaxID=29727 RepID=A0ABC8IX89_ERUVS|nr:unnamed protein product [Eruca vesicaria subsp. sativa]